MTPSPPDGDPQATPTAIRISLVASSTASPPARTVTSRASPSPSATAACRETSGSFESSSLATKLLRSPLKYDVYLPPCYRQQPLRRYPVLYLFHGLLSKMDQWDRIGVDEAANEGIAAGELPSFIIVMPEDPYTTQPPENKFDQAIVKDLVPYIDVTYRTIPDRLHRAVGGLSRGGGWAVHLGMVYWDVFGALGGHSPAIFFSDYSGMKSLIRLIPTGKTPRIYLDIGDRDNRDALSVAEGYEEMLDQMDLPHEWHLFSGYHNEAYWSAHVRQYLLWYTQGW